MIPVTIKENKSYRKQRACHICKKEFSADNINKKYFRKMLLVMFII